MSRMAGISLLIALCAAGASHGQSPAVELPRGYPAQAVRIIVGNAPGGGTDTIARMVAGQLTERWKRPVVVENHAGATGRIAMELVAKSPSDGHTIMLGGSQLVISMVLKKIAFDIRKVYVPIVQLTSQPYVLAIHPSLPAASVKDLITRAKSQPGKLNYGSSGNGSLAHLGMELFKSLAGLEMVHIPYKGGGPALADLVGGRIHLLLGTAVSVIPHARSGKLKLLGVTSTQRSATLPEVPTIAESGVPAYELNNSYGLYAPAATPSLLILALNREANLVIRTPQFSSRLAADGVEAAAANSPADYRNAIDRDIGKWQKFFSTPGLDLASFK